MRIRFLRPWRGRNAGQIDDATMADLNYRIDDGGEEPNEVARAFLEERGLIGGDD